jgi:hypothetical protein
MIILDQKGTPQIDSERRTQVLFELKRRSVENLSERSDIKSSRSNSRKTVIQARENKENVSLSINSQSDRKISSSKAFLKEVILSKNSDLIISSGEKSRGSRLNAKMPTVKVPAANQL